MKTESRGRNRGSCNVVQDHTKHQFVTECLIKVVVGRFDRTRGQLAKCTHRTWSTCKKDGQTAFLRYAASTSASCRKARADTNDGQLALEHIHSVGLVLLECFEHLYSKVG